MGHHFVFRRWQGEVENVVGMERWIFFQVFLKQPEGIGILDIAKKIKNLLQKPGKAGCIQLIANAFF